MCERGEGFDHGMSFRRIMCCTVAYNGGNFGATRK